MIETKPAIAVFVKTPGISPVKTRLAQAIGSELARQFYELSVAAVEATLAIVADAIDCDVYWAVAEAEAIDLPRWKRHRRICQGGGNLGERLSRVIGSLSARHSAVAVIGADSPQLTAQLLLNAISLLTADPCPSSHVMGRCPDGGFYLFGTSRPIDESVWNDIPWGESGVARTLLTRLPSSRACRQLPIISDVDHAQDLAALCQELSAVEQPTPSQLAVLQWAKQQVGDIA